MAKVILVICDALRDDTAAQQMGYLEHLVEERRAARFTVTAGLPTMSRPLYETLHTGLPASEHGITGNLAVRRSNVPNLFELAVQHGRTTAASAYCWFSELYNRAPYNLLTDREVDDDSLPIQHGRFYAEESYPDQEVFAAAAMLAYRFAPDYLLVHAMGMDTVGEKYGPNSAEYRTQAIIQDTIMAYVLPPWLEAGYMVLVTADHGINDDKIHGGTLPDVRHVPLYAIPPAALVGQLGLPVGRSGRPVSQLQIAPTLCTLLGLPVPPTMKRPSLVTEAQP